MESQQPSINNSKVQHLGYLDSLRAIAALYVVIDHAFAQVDFVHQPLVGFPSELLYALSHANFAVAVFITISGFCLMLPVAKGDETIRNGSLNFFKRRAWRILPPYYFAMLLSLVLIWTCVGQKTGTHWDVSLPVTIKNVITHLFLVHDVFGDDSTINHVFWSIAVEWRIYFLFPLLVWSWRKFDALPTTLVTIVFSYILYTILPRIIGSSLSAHYIGLFVMGMLGATIAFSAKNRLSNFKRLPWGWIVLSMTLVIIFLATAKIIHGRVISNYIVDYFVGIWSMALMINLSLDNQSLLSKILNYRPLVFIGTFAYSIYLVHAPLLQVLWQYIFAPLQSNSLLMFAALTIIGTPIIVGLSYVFFLVCEQPFIGKGKKRSGLAK